MLLCYLQLLLLHLKIVMYVVLICNSGFVPPTSNLTPSRLQLPPAMGVPVIAGGLFCAYQWDLCYGSKLERIKRMADEIENEPHWFTPSMPSEEEIERAKRSSKK